MCPDLVSKHLLWVKSGVQWEAEEPSIMWLIATFPLGYMKVAIS